jgi:ABC-type branched-subunit amino acid transport system substrate-binding protein
MDLKIFGLIIGIIVVLGAIVLGVSNSGLFTLSDKNINNTNIKLGITLALSGDGFSYGESELKGTELAVKDFELKHNVKVDLVVEDMMTDAKSSMLATQKLINVDKVDGIIGTTWLDTFQGAAKIASDNNVVMISPSGFIVAVQYQEFYNTVFSTYFRSDIQMHELLKHFKDLNYKKIVVFYEDNPFWQTLAKELNDYAKDYNIEVIRSNGIMQHNTDFRTLISETKALNPDAVFFGYDKQESTMSFAKQVSEIYPNGKIYSNEASGSLMQDEEYIKLFNGFYFIFPKDSDLNFRKYYLKEYSEDVGVTGSNAYDATTILLESILKSKQTGEPLLQIIKESEFNTVTFGKIKFDSIGGVQGGEFVIKQLVNGQLNEIK